MRSKWFLLFVSSRCMHPNRPGNENFIMSNQKVKKTGQGMSWPKQMGEDSDDAPLPSVNVHFYHKDIVGPCQG